MTQWQRHILGFALPSLIAATLIALAPEKDAPDWMIKVSAVFAVIAIVYVYICFDKWMKTKNNNPKVTVIIFLLGLVGLVLGIVFHQPALTALGGLISVAFGIFLTGLFQRWSDRLKHRPD